MYIVVMGVSGSGKSTIGTRLAQALGWPFVEGDDFHPPANIEKMRHAIPLDAADRKPWIDALVARLNAEPTRRAVLACSALTEDIRARLRSELADEVVFVYLKADPAVLRARLVQRLHHFAHADLLPSQLQTLQEPRDAVVVETTHAPDDTLRAVLARLAPKLVAAAP